MSETGDPALIGRRVAGKFVIEKFLGGGAMGEVYRARDTSLERNVALKVMHPSVAIDDSYVKRFHREARAASRLDHPNSMRVIEFGEEADGLLYIAMEFLEGRDLYQVIHEDWPLSNERIAHILLSALAALTMAHDMDVIHRDLKPENIMLLNRKDDEGLDIVKVCDFGIAKFTKDEPGQSSAVGAKLTTAGLVVGTPEYMSPEQARGETLDARSDLYSIGIILYQLLVGRTPFLADTALAVVLKHIGEAPQPPSVIYPGVHKGLEQVCLRALAKPREERFQSARDMRVAIRAVMDGRPIPVDTHASTAVAPTTDPSLRAVSERNVAAAASAVSGSMAASTAAKVTPPGTSVARVEEKRSPHGRLLVVLAIIALAGGAVLLLSQKDESKPSTPAPSESTPVEQAEPPPTSTSNGTMSAPEPTTSATMDPPNHTTKLRPPIVKAAIPRAPDTHASPGPTADPPPPPEPPTPTVQQPTAAPPLPAPAPPFNSQTCHAALGAQRSASGYNANNLTLHGTDTAWTGCVRSSIREKPAGPISATVHIRFTDNRTFKSATCNGCPSALAACIASSTRPTVSVSFRTGDATGDPEFDVPVTFSCD